MSPSFFVFFTKTYNDYKEVVKSKLGKLSEDVLIKIRQSFRVKLF